jgi:predicted HicB family RNase H-like nuclease
MAKYNADQYRYTAAWSEENQDFMGTVAEFPSLSAFADALEGALKEIKAVVEMAVEDLEETGEPIPEPLGLREYSGKLVLRMPTDLHRQLTLEAAEQGISINALICNRLAEPKERVIVYMPERIKKSRSRRIKLAKV